ncbi:MAG: hypothetical protein ABSF83_03290 [Nitrososphaerales archaeon]|jgi:hypothetical protein
MEKDKKSFRELIKEARAKGRAIGKERGKRIEEWSGRRRTENKHYDRDRNKIWRTFSTYLRSRNEVDRKAFAKAYGHLEKGHSRIWLIVRAGVLLVYGGGSILVTVWIVIPTLVSVYDFTAAQAVAIGVQVEGGFLSAVIIGVLAYFRGKRSGRKEVIDYDKLAMAFQKAMENVNSPKNTPRESPEQSEGSSQASSSSAPSQGPPKLDHQQSYRSRHQ